MSKNLFLIAALTILTSCASRHTFMRGTVAMKVDESTGIACMESNQVKVGDTLTLMNSECSSSKLGPRGGAACRLVPGGKVEVTRIVNDHYSEFKTVEGAEFSEGSIFSFDK